MQCERLVLGEDTLRGGTNLNQIIAVDIQAIQSMASFATNRAMSMPKETVYPQLVLNRRKWDVLAFPFASTPARNENEVPICLQEANIGVCAHRIPCHFRPDRTVRKRSALIISIRIWCDGSRHKDVGQGNLDPSGTLSRQQS